jgi:WD40 repeat protein
MVHVSKLHVRYLFAKCAHTLVQAGVSSNWAHDSQRFLLEFFDTIQDSPSQIYHFALPLCPPSSWIYNSYATELSREVKMIKGLPAGWGTCLRTVTLGDSLQAIAYWKDAIAVGFHDIVTLDGITGSQIAVLSGHTKSVKSLSFSLDGTLLASGSFDKTLKLWDVQTGGVVKTFHGHTKSVSSISISSNCTIIASGSRDNTIRLWDIGTGECQCIIQEELVKCVTFPPTNPQHLISVSGGVVQWWDISGCKLRPSCKGSYASFSFDGTHFALCGGKVTTVQNSNSGAIIAECPTDMDSQYCCFSPNGELVAIATGTTVYIWDIASSDPHLIETFIGHANNITFLAFSSSSSLISASNDRSIKFWQIGAPPAALVTSDSESTPSTSVSIRSVSLQAESGITITSDSDGMVRIWNISTGLCKESFHTPVKDESWRDAQMIDGRLVVVWLGIEGIHTWDTKKGELLHMMKLPPGNIGGLRISGDGSKVFLLIGGLIQAWCMQTGKAVGEVKLEDETYLDLFHMGDSRICLRFINSTTQGWDFGILDSSPVPLLSTSLRGPCLEFIGAPSWCYHGPLWIKNTVTGKEVFRLSGRYARPSDVQWDGQHLVAGYESGEVLILDFNQMLPQ